MNPAQSNSNNAPSLHNVPLTQVVCCESCDTLYRRIPLKPRERAYCVRCGNEIYRGNQSFNNLLALTLTALILFVLANSFPIVEIELQGRTNQTTLLGAVQTMFQVHREFIGVILLVTTFIIPLIDLLLLGYIMVFVRILKTRPPFLIFSMRTLYLFKTWGMVEVFLIGLLVTLVKLVGMVIVIPEVALWSFAILSVLLVYMGSLPIQDIWDEIDRRLS